MKNDWKQIETEILNLCIILWEKLYDIVNEIDDCVIIEGEEGKITSMKLDKDNVMHYLDSHRDWVLFATFEEAKHWNVIPHREMKNIKELLSRMSRTIALHRYQKEVIINSLSFSKRQDKEEFYKFLITEKNEYTR
jgi:hypothetical protein